MRKRSKASAVENLAEALRQAEAERDRADAALEAFKGGVEERLAVVDGGEALGEVSTERAAADRSEIAAEGDGLKDAAARSKRAVAHIAERLIAAVRKQAEALKAEPLAQHRSAVAERDEALRRLAKREEHVTATRAAYRGCADCAPATRPERPRSSIPGSANQAQASDRREALPGHRHRLANASLPRLRKPATERRASLNEL